MMMPVSSRATRASALREGSHEEITLSRSSMMERVRIPNEATYSPVSLIEVALSAPILSRVLLGATLPGQLLQTAALGVYAASSAQDWLERLGVRKIDFLREFGADVHHLTPMPREVREQEMRVLAERVNDGYVPTRIPRAELAVEVDRHLTEYIASITGQRVETSTEVRSVSLLKVLFPFALGACDFLSGDVAIFRDTGIFEPHVITHEFCHRKGYYKELEAQALAYFALSASGEPVLVQSALSERLHRHLRVLAGEKPEVFGELVEGVGLRRELRAHFLKVRPQLGPVSHPVATAMRAMYDARMRLTGQNGLSDYDLGFTNFLYTYETSAAARRLPPPGSALHAAERAALTP
ncbi:MAG: DUF3810 family protein [Longimicrobiaceae bacterium]